MSETVNFAAVVSDFVREAETRMNAVFRQSVQDLVEDMQRVGPSVASTKAAIAAGVGTTGKGKKKKLKFGPVAPAGEGGNLPVDTGFLRASLVVNTTGFLLPTRGRPDGEKAYSYDSAVAALVIADAKIGDTVYASYTANYAWVVHYGSANRRGYQWVALAAQRWPQIVATNCARLQSMISGGARG